MQQQDCFHQHDNFTFSPNTTYCNTIYDGFLCWAPTPAAQTTYQHCPDIHLSDPKKLAFRRCGADGVWTGRNNDTSTKIGWTNYTPCFPPLVKSLLDKVYDEGSEGQRKFQIAQGTRYLEIVGFSLSLVALIISLWIFIHFRALHNMRTRIHKNLFIAMIMQVTIRLVLYIDQEVARSVNQYPSKSYTMTGVDSMPFLCESIYVLLEYTITVMFVWFFIEGLYLHNLVTASSLKESISYAVYLISGWIPPSVITFIWAVVTAFYYNAEYKLKRCWYGYNFLSIYWIAQGPRFAIIAANLYFLLNILKTLVGKLNNSQTNEMTKMLKAAKAGLVLIPLLGITNVLNMVEPPLNSNVYYFGIWCYTTHFLRSGQGFAIALIYCFLNGEVRQVLSKHWENYKAIREYRKRGDSFIRDTTRRRPRISNARATIRFHNDVDETDFGGIKPNETRPSMTPVVKCYQPRGSRAQSAPETTAIVEPLPRNRCTVTYNRKLFGEGVIPMIGRVDRNIVTAGIEAAPQAEVSGTSATTDTEISRSRQCSLV